MHPGTIPALLRVARRVLIWIEPLLFRVIRLSQENSPMVRALLDAMESKPPEFFHNSVRHLALELDWDCSEDEGRQLLALCKGVSNFGSSYGFTDPVLLPFLAEMRIQRLSLTLSELFGPGSIDLTHSLFRSVTHLDMFGLEGVVEVFPDVPLLPVLTHLCLDSNIQREILLNLLAELPRLKLLLVQWQPEEKDLYELARTPRAYDVRFVIGLCYDYWADWEAGARGLSDPWAQGDDFVARKRKHEIEATCYWLE
ncbi:hypothetical protein MVEN_02171600 [Mycena venus]|uniref:Uncharacterized protein n=1 Tax=Mycena venus TaxID=2733690 RepID=A0A8H7CHK3_9AGAR|nr:hypothetical protein MVEN_02171600 [Mycena venus]